MDDAWINRDQETLIFTLLPQFTFPSKPVEPKIGDSSIHGFRIWIENFRGCGVGGPLFLLIRVPEGLRF